MPITLKTRKPVDKLTPADFDEFPVWEFATDEEGDDGRDDETWVRPVNRARVRLDEYSQLVAAKFTTNSGKALCGFMVLTTADDPVEITPGAIISRGFYGVLPSLSRKEARARKMSWSLKAREDLTRRLRLKEASLFPISYELSSLISGEKQKRKGAIE